MQPPLYAWLEAAALAVQPRPGAGGHGAAQLRGGGAGGGPRVPARADLGRAGAGPDGGAAGRGSTATCWSRCSRPRPRPWGWPAPCWRCWPTPGTTTSTAPGRRGGAASAGRRSGGWRWGSRCCRCGAWRWPACRWSCCTRPTWGPSPARLRPPRGGGGGVTRASGRGGRPWRSAWPWPRPGTRRCSRRHGRAAAAALLAPSDAGIAAWPGLLEGLLDLAPATLPLGLFGAWRAIRQAPDGRARRPRGRRRGASGCSGWPSRPSSPAAWPGGPRPALTLFLLVPLNLLAARAMIDLAGRRIPVPVAGLARPGDGPGRRLVGQLPPARRRLRPGPRPSPRPCHGPGAAPGRWTSPGRRPGHPRPGPLGPAPRRPPSAGPGRRSWARWSCRRRLGPARGPASATARRPTCSPCAAMILRRHQARPFTLLAVVGPAVGRPLRRRPARPAAGSGSCCARPCPTWPS